MGGFIAFYGALGFSLFNLKTGEIAPAYDIVGVFKQQLTNQ